MNKEGIFVIKISKEYKISPSVCYGIRNFNKKMLAELPRRNYAQISMSDQQNLQKRITNHYKLTTVPFTVREIRNVLESETNLILNDRIVYNTMKKACNLTYTRWKSRPNNVNMEKVQLFRALFAISFSQILTSKTLIINIDESTLSRNTKQNYAWNLKGNPKEYRNSSFKGSSSLIWAIASNGAWVSFILNSTINSVLFCSFLDKIEEWLINHNKSNYDQIIITLDNCPCHRSKQTTKRIKKLKCKVMYLPAYSPSLAPIESTFSFIKGVIVKQCRGKNIDLTTASGRKEIVLALGSLSAEKIRSYFRLFYYELKQNLEAAYRFINY